MTASGILAPIYARVERAEEHLRTLNDEVFKYSDERPYRPVIKGEAELRRMVDEFRRTPPRLPKAFDVIASEVSPPPDRIAFLISDIIHSLRSALDNLAVVLVDNHSTGTAIFTSNRNQGLNGISSGERLTAFPMRINRPSNNNAGMVELLYPMTTPAIEAVLEPLQPYNRGTRLGDTAALLTDFSNSDKHHTLRTSVAIVSGTSRLWIEYPDRYIAGTRWNNLHTFGINGTVGSGPGVEVTSEIALEDGALLGFLPVADAVNHLHPGDGQMNVNAEIAVKVTLDEPGTAEQRSQSVVDLCRGLIDFVHDDVVRAIEMVL